MIHALQTVDGVGLARTVCQEPRLCSDILAGKVTGAKKQLLDNHDLGLTNFAAGSQMKQVGLDQEAIDLSCQSNVDAFMSAKEKWMEMLLKEGLSRYGYVDLQSVPAVPYGLPLTFSLS